MNAHQRRKQRRAADFAALAVYEEFCASRQRANAAVMDQTEDDDFYQAERDERCDECGEYWGHCECERHFCSCSCGCSASVDHQLDRCGMCSEACGPC